MASREKRSIRLYKNADGSKSSGPSVGGSLTFQLLDSAGKTVAHSWSTKDLSADAVILFAQFGYATKIGNVANSVFNSDEPGTTADAVADIAEFLDAVNGGQWREPGEGKARGPRFDKDVLAAVLYAGRSADKRVGIWESEATLRTALENDKSFYAKVRANTNAMHAYHTEMARRGAASGSIDDIA